MINVIYQILSVTTFLDLANISVQSQAYTRLPVTCTGFFYIDSIKQSPSSIKKLLDFLEAMNKKHNRLQGGHAARKQKDTHCIH